MKDFLDPFSSNPSNLKRNGHAYPDVHPYPSTDDMHEEHLGSSSDLTDEIDHQILMHRDAHFGGDFSVMLKYYSNDNNVGIHPDFDPERIAYLAEVEKEIGQDLASLLLTGAEAESVGRARRAYAQLKEIYETEEENPIPRLLADLILTEEEEPVEEIEAVVSQGTRIVPDLLALLKSDDLYEPLFPGYGYAPYLAIICLGKIKDERAIIPLFESLSKQCIFDEIAILESLAEIGEPAKEFLIKIVKSRPLTQDNANAAFALTAFLQDPQLAIMCFNELKDPQVQEKPLLRTYLLCCCDALGSTPYRDAFIKMAQDPHLSSELRTEMEHIIKEWPT